MKSIRCPDIVYDFNTKRTKVMTSQKPTLWNYGNDWHIQQEQHEKCSLAKNQPVCAIWWGDIHCKQCYALMTLYESFENRPGLLTLQSKTILEGFVWCHQSKPVIISTHQFALTGWVLARVLFSSCPFWMC